MRIDLKTLINFKICMSRNLLKKIEKITIENQDEKKLVHSLLNIITTIKKDIISE